VYSGVNGYILATPPSFPRLLVTDASNDSDILTFEDTQCSEIKESPYPELKAVSYLSDGKLLNVTFWLSGPFEKKPTSLFRSPLYSMAIGTISDYKKIAVDYTISIQWDAINGVWSKTIDEYSLGDHRIVKKVTNYSVSFDNTPAFKSLFGNSQQNTTKAHVDLSLNLSDIGSPEHYFILFQVADILNDKGVNCIVTDFSDNAVFIPPPKFSISTSEGPLILRPNDNRTIQLKINSTLPTTSNISFSGISAEGLNLNFLPQNESLVPSGLTVSRLQIRVLETAIQNEEQKVYTIPIKATIHFPRLSLGFPSTDPSTNIDVDQSISPKPYYLTLTVLPPLNIQESFSKFVTEWITPITGLWTFLAGIGAVMVPLILRKYRKEH
jgi:hypothetical protein